MLSTIYGRVFVQTPRKQWAEGTRQDHYGGAIMIFLYLFLFGGRQVFQADCQHDLPVKNMPSSVAMSSHLLV